MSTQKSPTVQSPTPIQVQLTPTERPIPPRRPQEFVQMKTWMQPTNNTPNNSSNISPTTDHLFNLNASFYHNEYASLMMQHHQGFGSQAMQDGSSGSFGGLNRGFAPANPLGAASSCVFAYGHHVPSSAQTYNVNCNNVANWRLRAHEFGLNAMQL